MTNPAPSQRLAAVTAVALAAVVVLARRPRARSTGVLIDLRVTIDRPNPQAQPPKPAQPPRAGDPARRGHLRVVPVRGTGR